MALFTEDISINTILGAGSVIHGNIKINGFMRIDGDLDGNLETSGNLIIGENARIQGDIIAKSVTIGGLVKGNIIAPAGVHLLASSMVIGDIQTHSFTAEENVIFHGHCISISEESAYKTAVSNREYAVAIAEKSLLV